tara:strand:+ start:6404 stop:8485 length:2082 start_codon:yes stop_codon:yes gene_type:complete
MKIDCIIPLYNKKNFIINSVNSALNQKTKRFNKIIVINDGSTDGGELLVNKIFQQNKYVEIYNQNNSGSSEARNTGVKYSKADFVVFLDADDQLHKKYLLCLHLMLNKHPNSKIFSSKHHNIYENLDLINNSMNLKLFNTNIIKLHNPIFNYSFNQRIFCSSGICIERNLIQKNSFPKNANVGEDIYVWLKIFRENHLIYYDEELIYIFKNSENRSVQLYNEVPFYLKKITEFQSIKKISYKIYFLISSLIFLYQTKNEKKKIQEYFNIIKQQSLGYYYILKIFDNPITYNLYKIFKRRKDNLAKNKLNISTENFLLITANYFLVLPSIPIIILVFYLTKQYELISDVLIISSLTIMFTSSISLYARPFALIKNEIRLILFYLKLKQILFYPLFLILTLIAFLINYINFHSIVIGIFFILYIWRVEANLAIYELSNSKNLLIKKFFELFSATTLLISTIIFDNVILKYLLLLYLLYLNFLKNYYQFNITSLKNLLSFLKKIYHRNFFLLFANSFTFNLANFLHRFLILFYVEKTFAGILFFIYSMGSFPSNLFNYVFTPTIIRNKFRLPVPIIIITTSYSILFIYFTYVYFFNIKNSLILNFFQKEHLLYVIFSMIGGMIMSYAIFNKNKIFKIKNSLNKIFKAEFIYSIFVLSLIPIFNKFLNQNDFGYLFFLNSIIALFIFSSFYKINKNV